MRALKGQTMEEHIQSADHAIHSIMRRITNRPRMEPITPLLLSSYIENESKALFYVPIKCRFESFDVVIDSIEVEEREKMTAMAAIRLVTLNEGIFVFELPVKTGRFTMPIDKEIISPTKVIVSFNKPVSAWISLVAYPTVGRVIKVEEGLDEGIQLPLLESTEGNKS